MRKLIAVMLILMGTTAASAGDYRTSKLRFDMWLEVCLTGPYSCDGVKVPKVKRTSMEDGLYGYYDGGDTVYINRKLWANQKRATLYHEMLHYLQKQVGGLIVPGPAEQICHAEAEAFEYTDKWWVRIGNPSKQRGDTWWRPYRHCHKYYNPDYEPTIWDKFLDVIYK